MKIERWNGGIENTEIVSNDSINNLQFWCTPILNVSNQWKIVAKNDSVENADPSTILTISIPKKLVSCRASTSFMHFFYGEYHPSSAIIMSNMQTGWFLSRKIAQIHFRPTITEFHRSETTNVRFMRDFIDILFQTTKIRVRLEEKSLKVLERTRLTHD